MVTGQVTPDREAVIPIGLYDTQNGLHDQRRLIYVHATEGGALVGMSLLCGSLLKMRVVDGGEVTIEPIL